jgi:hypothetical protein
MSNCLGDESKKETNMIEVVANCLGDESKKETKKEIF